MLSNNCSILLIDDDADVLDAYTQLLEQAGYHVSACNNPFDAREQVPKDWPGIVLSDVCMPGCSGIDLMTVFHQDDDLLPILLITGHGDVPMAVEAVKKGAWDFLQIRSIRASCSRWWTPRCVRGNRLSPVASIVSKNYRLSLLAAANGRFGIASAFSSWQKRILRYGFTASREPAA